MQVFKLYFKILKRHKGQMIMYIGIFVGLLFGIIIPNAVKNDASKFEDSKCKYAIFDYDNSELSEAVKSYLENKHTLVKIDDDEMETIQDELYERNVGCVVRIKEGFSEAFTDKSAVGSQDKIKDYLEIYAIPDVNNTQLFEQNINSYNATLYTYVNAGFGISEAIEKTNDAENIAVNVSLPEGGEVESQSPFIYMAQYLGWIFIAMCIVGVAPVLTVFDRKEIRDRIGCSSYKFSRINIETLAGVMVTGVGICGVFVLVALIGMREELLCFTGFLHVCNMLCYMMVALSLTYLISRITAKPDVISVMGNIISLGMSFLCGVFVPMELLSDTVIKIAHFLPAYWFVSAIDAIKNYSVGDMPTILSYMGIELLFAAAIVVVAIVVYRNKRVA